MGCSPRWEWGCSVALLVLRCICRIGLLSSQVSLVFPINDELVPARSNSCQLLLEGELSFADCKADRGRFLSRCLLGVFMCFHLRAGEKPSVVHAACKCPLRCTNALSTHQAETRAPICYSCLCLTYEFLLFPQMTAEAHLFCLVVLTQHRSAECKSKQVLGKDGGGGKWARGFLTPVESSQVFETAQGGGGCLLAVGPALLCAKEVSKDTRERK